MEGWAEGLRIISHRSPGFEGGLDFRGMAKTSAGLLMYRVQDGVLEVLLVHPGGPFWARKDQGAWFVPKGEIEPGEGELAAAQREFEEETGIRPAGPYVSLGSVKHKSGKQVIAWAFAGTCNPSEVKSNTFMMEWPPRSGQQEEFPEVDRAEFFTVAQARARMHKQEFELLERLEAILERDGNVSES
jgi:predicted NUDIX family NTP pyrophosphohydrolase